MPVLAVIAQPSPERIDYHAEEFDNGAMNVADALDVKSGFVPGPYGWDLPPGVGGELTYTIRKRAGKDLLVNLWLYSGGRVPADLSVRLDGGPPQPLAHNPMFHGEVLYLPAGTAQAGAVELDLSATNQTSAEVLVLDRLTFSTGPVGPPYPNPHYSNWALGALAGLIALPLISRRQARPAIALGVALIVGIAADLRMPALIDGVHRLPPNPDTIAYQNWADHFQWWPLNRGFFCGCYGPREPVWIAVGHLVTQLFGSSTFHLRATSILISIGNVALAIAAARRRLSWPSALAVGVLLALNGNVISNATRGLRTELEVTLSLTLYILLDRETVRNALSQATAAGLVGAALVLTRSFFLPVVIVADAISLLRRFRFGKQAVLLMLVAVGLPLAGIAGHRLALYEVPYEQYGLTHDPFLDTDSYARWIANNEKFALGRDLPHPELFPSRQEFENCGPYCGPHLTYYQYLFVLHTPGQVIVYSLAGYGDVLATTGGFLAVDRAALTGDPAALGPRPLGGLGNWVDAAVRDLGLVGLLVMLLSGARRPRNLLVPVMFFGILGFAVFLYHLRLIEAYYNVIQAWPFLFIAALWSLEAALQVAAKRRNRQLAVARLVQLRPLLTPVTPLVLAALVGASVLALSSNRSLGITALLAGITALAITAACLLDPVTGVVALVAAVALLPGEGLAAAVSVGGLAGLVWRLRPTLVQALPAAAAGPFALGLALSGAGTLAGRPTRAGLEAAVVVLALAAGIVLASASPGRRHRLFQRLPLLAPLIAVAALLALVSDRVPPLVAAGPGTVMAVMLAPLAVAFITWRRGRVIGAVMALAGVFALMFASLASTVQAPAAPSWRTYLAHEQSLATQSIESTPPGDDRVWVFARRSSRTDEFTTEVTVDGTPAGELDPLLPTSRMGWTALTLRAALQPGVRHMIEISLSGRPDVVNKYVDIGGTFASDPAVRSRFADPEVQAGLLSPDGPGAHGTLLIFSGGRDGPSAPSALAAALPALSQPPLDRLVAAGEEAAQPAAREGGSPIRTWPATLEAAWQHPLFGLGPHRLSAAIASQPGGFLPGLSARNQYLQTAAESGLFGLLGLLFLIAAAAVSGLGDAGRARIGLLGALAALILLMGFQSVLATPPGLAAAVSLLTLCLARPRNAPATSPA